MGKTVNIVRYVFFGALSAISVVTLGLSANLIATYSAGGGIVFVYMALDMAAAVLLLAVLIPSVVVDFFRRGAFTSMVAVEIGWTSVLMIIWVAAAGETTAELPFVSCRFVNTRTRFLDVAATDSCVRQQQSLQAMTWLGFIALLAWFITLISLAATAHSRGNSTVWKKSVTSTDFAERVARKGKTQQTDYQNYPSAQPMQQQNTGYSPQPGYPPHPAAQPLQQQQNGMGYPPHPAAHPGGYQPNGQYPAGYNNSAVAQV